MLHIIRIQMTFAYFNLDGYKCRENDMTKIIQIHQKYTCLHWFLTNVFMLFDFFGVKILLYREFVFPEDLPENWLLLPAHLCVAGCAFGKKKSNPCTSAALREQTTAESTPFKKHPKCMRSSGWSLQCLSITSAGSAEASALPDCPHYLGHSSALALAKRFQARLLLELGVRAVRVVDELLVQSQRLYVHEPLAATVALDRSIKLQANLVRLILEIRLVGRRGSPWRQPTYLPFFIPLWFVMKRFNVFSFILCQLIKYS